MTITLEPSIARTLALSLSRQICLCCEVAEEMENRVLDNDPAFRTLVASAIKMNHTLHSLAEALEDASLMRARGDFDDRLLDFDERREQREAATLQRLLRRADTTAME